MNCPSFPNLPDKSRGMVTIASMILAVVAEVSCGADQGKLLFNTNDILLQYKGWSVGHIDLHFYDIILLQPIIPDNELIYRRARV